MLNNIPFSLLYFVFPSATTIFVRLVHLLNILLPVLVTLFGIVTLVKLVHPLNAEFPIIVTVFPPKLLGIVITVPVPLYFVIVAVTLSVFTVYS